MNREYAWLFLHWMPYDNQMWVHGEDVLDMLKAGAKTENVLICVVSDLRDEDWLTRRMISGGRVVHEESWNVADSSSAQIYAANLEWLRARFSARRWAHVFLGHGGRLDEICPDESTAPGVRTAQQWMNIQDLAQALESHKRHIGDRLELLFLQNCCKGTLEALYCFRNAARYSLASQARVGAPNRYYEPFFLSLGQSPDISGVDVPELIMASEQDKMYNSFTAIDNKALCDLPAKLNPVVDAILSRGTRAHLSREVTRIKYARELLVDAVPFLRSVVDQVGADPKPLVAFEEYLHTELILRHAESPRTKHPGLCGLSLFFPTTDEELERYRHLDIYSETSLADLFDVVSYFPVLGDDPPDGGL